MGALMGYLTPIIGLNQAIQIAGLGVAIVGGGGGIVCVIIAHLAPSIDRIDSQKIPL
jgi:hypothetical protein